MLLPYSRKSVRDIATASSEGDINGGFLISGVGER